MMDLWRKWVDIRPMDITDKDQWWISKCVKSTIGNI